MILAAWATLPTWVRRLIPAIILALTALAYGQYKQHAAYKDGRQDGADIEQLKANKGALDNVEKSKKAAEAVATDPAVRNAECLRNARNPQSC